MRFLTAIVDHNFFLTISVALGEEAMGEARELGELGTLGKLGELEPRLGLSTPVETSPERNAEAVNLPELLMTENLMTANPSMADWNMAMKCL